MVFLVAGFIAGLLLAVARVMVRRRRARTLVAPGDRDGLPSRLRDPETGEHL